MTFSLQHSSGNTAEYPATFQGLTNFLADPNLIPGGSGTITLNLAELEPEQTINFIAILQKSWKHCCLTLGLHPPVQLLRPKIWRRYWRNNVDRDHGLGTELEAVIQKYLIEHLNEVKYHKGIFTVKCKFKTVAMAGAGIGRLINLATWSQKYTKELKLVSEVLINWNTFNKVSLDGERGIYSKKKKKR